MDTEDIFRIVAPTGERAYLLPGIGYDNEEQYYVIGTTGKVNLFPMLEETPAKSFVAYMRMLDKAEEIGFVDVSDIRYFQKKGLSAVEKVATVTWNMFHTAAKITIEENANAKDRKFFGIKTGETTVVIS